MSFSKEIINWYCTHRRDLPWRETVDPYKIWLSEVILQQTRVAQGMDYYYTFSENFPTVQALALAEEDEVLRLWQGLGYYSRARNLHKAAKIVVNQFNGVFPSSYSSLLTLPGIGEYTAAAVASFSANEVHAVLDGNVFRVLARVFGLNEPINSSEGKKVFSKLANELIDPSSPATYNQAIMEFGALQCKPKNPDCAVCPISSSCYAFIHQEIDLLPVKFKKAKSRNRYFNYFVIKGGESILMNKRGKGDIWQHLHDFPLIESDNELSPEELIVHPDVVQVFGTDLTIKSISKPYKHVLSHQNIYARFFEVSKTALNLSENTTWNYVLIKDLDKLAKPKLIVFYMESHFLI
ncbi:MAG TPA: A/G-specific adenine glycosylase [Sphingobacteriaceae bacterium]|nr:A/G-specific adenine glycosylase [Sphingobacteriaceae bacterium]